jgi:DNA-binding PadR family transcriptional regulator
MRHCFEYFWPRADARVYAEAKRLAISGLARASEQRTGRRRRTAYAITPAGRRALRRWLATPPKPIALEFEALVKVYLARLGTRDDLVATLEATAADAAYMLEVARNVRQVYLDGCAPFQDGYVLRGPSSTTFSPTTLTCSTAGPRGLRAQRFGGRISLRTGSEMRRCGCSEPSNQREPCQRPLPLTRQRCRGPGNRAGHVRATSPYDEGSSRSGQVESSRMIRSSRSWPNRSRSRTKSQWPPARLALRRPPGPTTSDVATPAPPFWISVCTLGATCAKDPASASPAHGATFARLNAWSGDASRASVCG